MAYYQSRGSVPPKRHTQHRDPDGKLYFEELMGEEGFSSDSSLLYHRAIPSALVDARTWVLPTPYSFTTPCASMAGVRFSFASMPRTYCRNGRGQSARATRPRPCKPLSR